MVKLISAIRLGMVIGVSSLVLIGAAGCGGHDDDTTPPAGGTKAGGAAATSGSTGTPQAGAPLTDKPKTLPPPGK